MASWSYTSDTRVRNLTLMFQARMSPQAPFISDGDGTVLSYGDYWELSGRLANVMAEHGVKRGDRVAVQVEKSIPALALFLASLRVGAIFLPLNTAYTVAELAYFIGDAEPSLIICDPSRLKAISELAPVRVLTLDGRGNGSLHEAASRQPSSFADADLGWDDLAAILYTSGTTGRSKGAMLSHGNLASNAMTLVAAWRFNSNDVLLHALPIYHTHGLFVAANTAMLAGAQMIFRAKFDADDTVKRLPEATVLMGVPTFYTRLLQHKGFTREAAAHMRLFVSGSAPLLAETHRQFEELTGHAILERYGMTETNMNTSNPYDGARKPGTVGPPLPGVLVRVTDPATGAALPQGETGMIEVKGPNVFKGYWRNPEKTAEEFRGDGHFITGDLGVIDTDGYVSIVGRGKDLIISGGFNVYPKEVESEIDSIAGIAESAVIGVPHPDFGEAVVAVVTSSSAKLTEQDVIGQLASRLARFKQPKRVFFVDELPRNAMGKVQKNVLREAHAGLFKA